MLLVLLLLMLDWRLYNSHGLMYVLSEGAVYYLEIGCERYNGYIIDKEACSIIGLYFKYLIIIPFSLFLYGLYPLLSTPKDH